MCKYKLSKVYWKDIAQKVKDANEELYKLLSPIMVMYNPSGKDYLYMLCIGYGDLIIKNGKSEILSKENGIYTYESIIKFEPENIFQNFVVDCGDTNGHPLAMVVKNNVELSKQQNSSYSLDGKQNGKKYDVVLGILNRGNIFGAWEATQKIFGDIDDEVISSWNATAGKTILWSTLPKGSTSSKNSQYRKLYSDLFHDNDNPTEGCLYLAKKLIGDEYYTELFIFPDYLYMFQEIENIELQKYALREYICKIGWKQEDPTRKLLWHENLVTEYISHYDPLLSTLVKHILNIVNKKVPLIKPITSNDVILYNVMSELFERFKKTPYPMGNSASNLLNYNTPVLFHYDYISGEHGEWGFEMAHSPCMNINLPPLSIDTLKKKIEYIKMHKLNSNLKKDGIVIDHIFRGKSSNGDNKIMSFLSSKSKHSNNSLFEQHECDFYMTNMYDLWFLNALFTFEIK